MGSGAANASAHAIIDKRVNKNNGAERGREMLTLYLAGGCFWGVQKYFDQFRGVESTEVGYANGPDKVRLNLAEGAGVTGTSGAEDVWEEYVFSETEPPYYETVCAGIGYAETVKVVYDPAVLPTKTLLGYYFDVIDPLAVNRQGPDVGVQYRTGIFYEEAEADELLPVIQEVVKEKEAQAGQPLATEVAPLHNYYPAEEYHQKYLEKRPFGYCHIPKRFFFRQYAMDKEEEEGVE